MPYEAFAFGSLMTQVPMYSSGGLTQIIIDKKSRGMTISGYEFTSGKMESTELMNCVTMQKVLAFQVSFLRQVRDGLLFGGSVLYPIFKGDNPLTTQMNLKQLKSAKILKKDCIDYFAEGRPLERNYSS